MIERCNRAGLPLEARAGHWIGCEPRAEHLDGDAAIESGITRAIHLAHPACTELVEDVVGAEACGCPRRADAVQSTRLGRQEPRPIAHRVQWRCSRVRSTQTAPRSQQEDEADAMIRDSIRRHDSDVTARALAARIKVCMFDLYGTLVDIQKGLTD